MDLGEMLVPVVMFGVIFGMYYLYISARNKERLALIEKGADASIFFGPKAPGSGKLVLKLGILAVGIALGVLAGYLLNAAGMDEEVSYPASIFLFAGAALVAAYFIAKKVNGKEE